MLYKSVKFDNKWIYNFYPPSHHYLLVERSNSCTFSILLKTIWLKSGYVKICQGARWTYRAVHPQVLLIEDAQVH